MINLLLAYLTFLAIYDHWSTGSVAWWSVYFFAQYGFIAGIAIIEMFKGKNTMLFLFIALIMTIFSISELTWINESKESYLASHSGPPAFLMTACILIVLIFYLKPLRIKKWRM